MANKWAVQNGNWSDGSTWNDGVVPTADDDVWLNGFQVQADYVIECRLISNGVCAVTGLSGGQIRYANDLQSLDVKADCEAVFSHLFYPNTPSSAAQCTFNILGNTVGANAEACCFYGSNIHININGIAKKYSGRAIGTTSWMHPNVTGVMDCSEGPSFIIYNYSTIYVLGTLITTEFPYQPNNRIIEVTGTWKLIGPTVWTLSSNFLLSGILDLSECTAGVFPISPYNQFIYNVGLQIIYDYPNQNKVENGIVYAYGSKTGTLIIPQESAVLEGYEYGDKVGTLKTVPDNVTIVNLTEQEVNRVKNCATVSTVQKCFEDFKEE